MEEKKSTPGALLITFGILFILAGIVGFVACGPHMDTIRSGWGQLAISGGGQYAQEAMAWQMGYYGSIGLGALGALLFVAGIIKA